MSAKKPPNPDDIATKALNALNASIRQLNLCQLQLKTVKVVREELISAQMRDVFSELKSCHHFLSKLVKIRSEANEQNTREIRPDARPVRSSAQTIDA